MKVSTGVNNVNFIDIFEKRSQWRGEKIGCRKDKKKVEDLHVGGPFITLLFELDNGPALMDSWSKPVKTADSSLVAYL